VDLKFLRSTNHATRNFKSIEHQNHSIAVSLFDSEIHLSDEPQKKDTRVWCYSLMLGASGTFFTCVTPSAMILVN
jgi:hypothetical protein